MTATVNGRPITISKMATQLEAVRKLGHDVRRSPVAFGATDISFPLFGFDGRLARTLTIPFLQLPDGSQKVGLEAATSRLSDTARQISGVLGWREAAATTDTV